MERLNVMVCLNVRGFVMPGLVPGIHVFGAAKQDVDGRDKPGHDENSVVS